MDVEQLEDSLTSQVVDSFAQTADPRLRSILQSLTTHLHAFIQEISPSIEEWEAAIDFLTRTGKTCTDTRQEFILLSDVLGVSMLVEEINDAETPEATDSTVLGPFHMVDSPTRDCGDNISPESVGTACVVAGQVLSTTGDPIAGAKVDIWQADDNGFYDVQPESGQSIGNGRALLTTDTDGAFWFRSIVPSFYPIPTDGPVGELLRASSRHPNRPAHIHFQVSAPGYKELTTHIFVAEDPWLSSDAVFAVKPSLVRRFVDDHDERQASELGLPVPFRRAHIDLVLNPDPESETSIP
ncbi:dioxygenase family protein [Kineococcus sp. SYSU DK003]|uniref:dioxygenase family protein n=1 Tax=Kineococcus sp. SYSU DK003 TaxID=3383124 RepID=UPI003D7EAAEB